MRVLLFFVTIFAVSFMCCNNTGDRVVNNSYIVLSDDGISKEIKPGIYNIAELIKLIDNKKIAVLGNQTSVVNNIHLVDTLISLDQNIIKVFCPEHGFRGTADAGELIDNTKDIRTGLPIISLYGKNKKPTDEQLTGVEAVVFDLQDVGVRFYTYISTLHYVMEACAENNIPVILLDRPNPNAHYVDGPILDTAKFRSFIGMHPVPVIYGMTIGEYGQMINGEKWLKDGMNCDLTIVKCENYEHSKKYSLPVKPSPNLPNDRSIELYPTLCFFEGTNLSIGRGTSKQFQIIGHPLLEDVKEIDFVFIPLPNEGASNPVLNGKVCYGFDLSEDNSIFDIEDKLNISVIKKVYELFPDKSQFFVKTNFFELLIGTDNFKQQIIDNVDEDLIRSGWEQELKDFMKTREKYLIYK